MIFVVALVVVVVVMLVVMVMVVVAVAVSAVVLPTIYSKLCQDRFSVMLQLPTSLAFPSSVITITVIIQPTPPHQHAAMNTSST